MRLTVKNIPDYVRKHKLVRPDEPVTVTVMGGGNINYLFKVESPSRSCVLKQAQPRTKFNKKVSLPVERTATEYRAMQLIRDRTGLPYVPKPIHLDRADNILAVTLVPEQYDLFTYLLLEGKINVNVMKKLGAFYASLHNVTYHDAVLEYQFPITQQFESLKFDLFHKDYIKTTQDPDIRRNLHMAIGKLYTNRICLIHGDALPKNMLVKGDDFYVLDFELSVYSDPAHDIGLFTSLILLSGIINYPMRKRYFQAIRAFLNAYYRTIRFKSFFHKIVANSFPHAAANLYGRIDGLVRVDFMDGKTRKIAKKITNKLAAGPYLGFEEVFQMVDEVGAPLIHNKPLYRENIWGKVLF